MIQRPLGRTGLNISPLVLGGNVFGWTADKPTSFAILDRLLAGGLETIDTADVYSAWVPGNQGGESESIIGEWMASRRCRARIIVITKVGHPMGPMGKGLSAAYIARAVEASLRRLQTDYIDLYLTHSPDATTPYQETLGALQGLLDAGKVRAIGASNLDASQLCASLSAASGTNLHRYDVLQPWYNLYDRMKFEGPLRDLCIAEAIGVIPYYSLARGFLSGKYRRQADLVQSPRGGGVAGYLNSRGMAMLDALDLVAANHGARPAEVALAWLAAQPGVTAPIASATSVDQVESLIASTQLGLSDEELGALSAV